VSDQETLKQIDRLQARYAEALDEHDMEAWLACFDEDGSYICIPRENVDANMPVAVMMDDTRARLVDRVKFICEVWAGTFEDYRTRHFIQKLSFRTDGAIVRARANFLVCFTSERGESGILANGFYEDEIRLTSAGAKFKSRKAIMDTFVTPRYLVYPI